MSDLTRLRHVLAESSDPDNPDAETVAGLVRDVRKVAVVGISRDPAKAARRVPSYMAAKGYEIVPINPYAERMWGKPVYRHLDEVDEPVDLVLVFRPSDQAGEVIESAAKRPERPAIWTQEAIRDDQAAARARADGLTVVQDLCFFKAHRALN